MIIIRENSTPEVIKEAYFGKSPVLQQAEAVLGKLVKEIKKDPYADYTNHKLNAVFTKLLEKQFGCKKLYVIWAKSSRAMPKAQTFVSSDLVFNPEKVATVDKRKGFYDKSHSHVAHITVSSTMVAQLNLTPGELMAAILHEFGHNFDTSPYYVVKMIIFYIAQISTMLTSYNTTYINGVPMQTSNSGAQMNAALNIARTTGPGKQLQGSLDEFVQMVMGQIPGLKAIMRFFHGVFDTISRSFELVLAPVAIASIPTMVLLSPLTHVSTLLTRKGEEFADSFAASYGYGPELASALNKMGYSNFVPKRKDLNPLARFCLDLVLAERYVIAVCLGADHGSDDTRMVSMLRELKKDLSDPSIPAGLKQDLSAEVKMLEKTYRNYVDAKNGEQQLILTTFLRRVVNRVFNGRSDWIAKLFPECNVRSALHESAVDEYFTDLLVRHYDAAINYTEACKENNLDKIALYENRYKGTVREIEMVDRVLTEAANIDKDIKPLIDKLNEKGYKTKYSSAGHPHLRKKEDTYRDGIYKGKLYSDARIMFNGDFNFPKAPKYWIWRNVEGNDYLDIDPKQYNPEKGLSPDEAFARWKACYMGTLKTWVENLPDANKSAEATETKDTKGRDVAVEDARSLDDVYDEIMESVLFDVI